MADNKFRSYGSRARAARDEFDADAPESASDPLAELARLIGQSDNYGRQERRGAAAPHEPAESDEPGLDWAADADDGYGSEPDNSTQSHYPARHDTATDRYYAETPEPPRAHSGPQRGYEGYEEEPPEPAPLFSRSSAKFNGFRAESGLPRAGYDDHGHGYGHGQGDNQAYADNQDYSEDYHQNYADEDHYDDEAAQPRRGGFVVVIAVLALAVLGTAGAFGYRAMFGGSVLSSLPPIIKASNGPIKIMPRDGDASASSGDQTGMAGSGSREQLAPPAEQPLDVQSSAKISPRVISTIPISPDASAGAPTGETTIASGGAPQIEGGPFPPAPAGTVAPAAAAPMVGAPAAPPPVADAPPPAVAAPATTSATTSEPRKVHTVAIHAEQQQGAAPSSPAATHHSGMSRGNEPLSLVPGAGGEAPAAPPAPHARAERSAMASEGTESSRSSGGYAVQVSSQRSEAEAKAAFRALQAKYPSQLGNREAMIHRADLGAKGTYYRALVGPFASAEAAAEMCSRLKAAGGNCLVQRN
jgi:hypothetical protein